MKKATTLFLLLIISILLTGCGKTQTLKCSMVISGLNQDLELVYNSAGTKLKSAKYIYKLDLRNLTEEEQQTMLDVDYCNQIDKTNINSCTTEDTTYGMNIILDLETNGFIEKEFGEERIDIEKAKENYEVNVGAVCTIE